MLLLLVIDPLHRFALGGGAGGLRAWQAVVSAIVV